MSRPRAVRAGHRWQPVLNERRIAGRRKLAMPKIHIRWPYLAAYWRQVAIVVVAASVAGFGSWWLYNSPLLTVRNVHVHGNVTLSPDVVRGIADVKGQSIIRPDFSAAERRLLAQPLIKEAHVSRDWPNGATVSVVERTAWGVWQVGTQRFVIDSEGVVLNLPAPDGAPVIVQTDASLPAPSAGQRVDIGAVGVASRLAATSQQTLGHAVVGFEFSQARGLVAVLDGDLRVTFGDAQGYDFKVASLFAVLQRASNAGTSVKSVDLRFGDRVAVNEN